jgi:hypothetical protein
MVIDWELAQNNYKEFSECKVAGTRDHFLLEYGAIYSETARFFSKVQETIWKMARKKGA